MSTLNNCPADLKPFLQKIMQAVATDVVNRSRNNGAREVIHRELSANGWNNSAMELCVRMACVMVTRTVILLKQKNQPMSEEQIINDAAQTANALFLSFIVMSEPSVANVSSQEVLQSSRNNFDTARVIINEANNMFGVGGVGGSSLMNIGGGGIGGIGGIGGSVSVANSPYANIANSLGIENKPSGFGFGASLEIETPLSQMLGTMPGLSDTDLKNHRAGATDAVATATTPSLAVFGQTSTATQQAQQPAEKPHTATNQKVTMNEGTNELDRPALKVFGQTMDVAACLTDLEISVMDLASNKKNLFVDHTAHCIGLSSAVSTAFSTHYKSGVGRASSHKMHVSRPFHVTPSMVNWLVTVKSTATSAKSLETSLLQTMERVCNNRDTAVSSKLHTILNAVTVINNVAADVLRSVTKAYSVTDIDLDSFIGDLDDAMKFIHTNRNAFYKNYEMELDSRIVAAISFIGSDAQPLVRVQGDSDETDRVEVAITYPVSVTTIDLTAAELGYNLPLQGGKRQIDASTTPILFKLARSINASKSPREEKCMGDTAFDYIATSDGVIYELDTILTPEGEAMRFIRRVV